MKVSTMCTIAGVSTFAASEGLAVHLMLSSDPSYTPGTADWVIVLTLGGPSLFFLIGIGVMLLGTLIAMVKYPR